MSEPASTAPQVPTEVAAAQEPWPTEPVDEADTPLDDTSPEPADDDEADDELPITGAEVARVAAARLHGLATPAQIGVVVLGGLAAFEGLSRGGLGTFGFLVAVGLLLVGSLVIGALLHGAGAALHALADQSESTARIEQRMSADLERLAATIEAATARAAAPAAAADERVVRLAELRKAIRARDWVEAAAIAAELARSHPDDPDARRLGAELAEARQAAAADLISRIAAAREVNDAERVLELRDELVGHGLAAPEARHELDRDLAKWFMLLIHRRLRTGAMRPDVAVLAGRVAQSLDDTPEGASLRASLPTLRRAAGLCPRCAQPYKGTADACPACLAAAVAATAPATPTATTAPAEPAATAATADEDDLESVLAPPPADPSDPLAHPWVDPDSEAR